MKFAITAICATMLLWPHGHDVRAEGPASETLAELRKQFESAARSFEVSQAREVQLLARAFADSDPSGAAIELDVRAALLVAELERLDFERLPRDQREARATLGKKIDAAARPALEQAGLLPESSERWRLRADLLATLIRSDFRARKHRRAFEEAVDHAKRLDAENPHAWVSEAKPFVFAGPKQGQDFAEAVRLLGRALELEPGLESALLLRGRAEELRGNRDAAAADWRTALDANPSCAPAREGLVRLDAESGP